ncbi:MAG: hypothetical protein WBV79_15705, partial [Rhodomicrobium sp.]
MYNETVSQSTPSEPDAGEKSQAGGRAPNEQLDFFDLLLPTKGKRCMGILRGEKFYHEFFDTNAQLAAAVKAADSANKNVFFGCSSFKDDRHRTQDNVEAEKSFWLDIDCGPGRDYATQADAIRALWSFCNELGLLKPVVVSSGAGIHCYWPMGEDIDPRAWKQTAELLKKATKDWGLKVDHSRTADSASVLRPVGTHNRKRETPKKVKIVAHGGGGSGDHAEFHLRLAEYVGEDAVQGDELAIEGAIDPRLAGDNSDLSGPPREHKPSDANKIAEKCAVVREMRDTGGRVEEPLWRGVLGIVARTVQGDELCHEWSAGHPKYSRSETQNKIDGTLDYGPTTCEKLSEHRPDACKACTYWQKVKSPITLGEDEARAEAAISADQDDGSSEGVPAGDDQKAPKAPKGPSQADRLLALSKINTEFFHDSNNEAFARFFEGGKWVVCRVSGELFKQALRNRYRNNHGGVPSDEAVRTVVKTREAMAVYEGAEREIYVRVARLNGTVYIDLAQGDGAVVEITPAGWTILRNAPVYFLTSSSAKPLPTPQGSGDITALARIVNAETKDDFILGVGWLLGVFGPHPYPVLVATGVAGSGKSTGARTMRNLVDPCRAPSKALPKTEQDLAIQAQNSLVVSIDNVSSVQDWLSDALCRLAT